MTGKQNIFIGFIALVCVVYLYLALQMEVGTVLKPGPGFVPAVLGVMGFVISLGFLGANVWKQKKQKEQEKTRPEDTEEKIDWNGWKRFAGYLLTVIVFIPLFEHLGSLIAIFFLVLALTKISGSKGWIKPLILAALTSICCYVVFSRLLSVPLPKGIFR